MNYTVEAAYRHGHGETPVIITTPDDVDTLVDALLQERLADNSVAALYVPERPPLNGGWIHTELRIAVNPDTGVGGLRYMGETGTWYATGRESDRVEVWYCYMGHDEDWPRDSEISLDEVRAGIKNFLESGGERPATGRWAEWRAAMEALRDSNASFLVPSSDTEPTDR